MSGHSDDAPSRTSLRDKIIGLGEHSSSKSYYPELQRRLAELQRFRELLDRANDAILLFDVQLGRLVDVAGSACRLLGYARADLEAMPLEELLTQEGAACLRRLFGEDAASSAGTVVSTTLPKVSGARVPVEMTVRLASIDGGLYAIAVARDIRERVRAEEELRDSESRFHSIFDCASDAIYILDNDRIVECNALAVEMFGWQDKRDLIGHSVAELSPKHQPDGVDSLAKVLELANRARQGERLRFYWKHSRKDGTPIDVEVSLAAMTIQGTTYVLAFGRDITDRLRTEEEKDSLRAQLLQAQKMESIGRLAGGVAHDFNNMLGVILGCSELAMLKISPNEPLHADFREIQRAAQRSAELTRQLLAFARKQAVTPKVVDLNAAVEGMLKMLRRLIGEDIELIWRPGQAVPRVRIDPAQVDQILANLCVNARDAIDGVGHITIETDSVLLEEVDHLEHWSVTPGVFAVLRVCDDGRGMAPDVLRQIFEPFFTTKEAGKGTGLGLATVYGVVRQNLGFIDVKSAPGEGTTLSIGLPRYLGEAAGEAESGGAAERRSGGESILLVEDEEANLRMVTTMLEYLGYRVVPANTAPDALRLARDHAGEIRLLVTDLVMPKMNGRDLARQIHTLCPDIKTLFMSGYSPDMVGRATDTEKDSQFLQKPFSVDDLAAKVRQILDTTG